MRVEDREVRYTPYQAPKMELFVEIVKGYFRKNLHLMFEICLTGCSEYASASLENTNIPRKVPHTKITTKTSAMKVVFIEGDDKI